MTSKPQLESNPRGIPRAPFIEDIVAHVGGPDAEVESALRQFQEAIAKYRYMEMNLTQRKAGLLEKIPDIEKTLSMVNFLKASREKLSSLGDEDDLSDAGSPSQDLKLTFELNDTLYAEAKINAASNVVYLWLGANVMLSYTQEEASSLLASKLDSAKQSLENSREDLEFLREQITIMEVNTARCYNWDVKRRRDARVAATGSAKP